MGNDEKKHLFSSAEWLARHIQMLSRELQQHLGRGASLKGAGHQQREAAIALAEVLEMDLEPPVSGPKDAMFVYFPCISLQKEVFHSLPNI